MHTCGCAHFIFVTAACANGPAHPLLAVMQSQKVWRTLHDRKTSLCCRFSTVSKIAHHLLKAGRHKSRPGRAPLVSQEGISVASLLRFALVEAKVVSPRSSFYLREASAGRLAEREKGALGLWSLEEVNQPCWKEKGMKIRGCWLHPLPHSPTPKKGS